MALMEPGERETLEYATPGREGEGARRSHGGCLIPFGVFVAVLGVFIYWAQDPLNARERREEGARLVLFLGIAFALVAAGVMMRRR